MDRYDTDLSLGMLAILRPASVGVLIGLGIELKNEHGRSLEGACAARDIHPLWVLDEVARAEGTDNSADNGEWRAVQELRPTPSDVSPADWLS